MVLPVNDLSLSFWARFWAAWACLFRMWSDGVFASQVRQLQMGRHLPSAALAAAPIEVPVPSVDQVPALPTWTSALQLLSLLQKEARFVDFVSQEIAAFSDADVGGVARAVHEGCRKVLAQHVELEPIRPEEEGGPVTLDRADPSRWRLIGNVQGSPPYRGILRHRGWQATRVQFPVPLGGYEPLVVAPAEVEL